jgi:anti-anti-sigma factor
MHMTVNITQGHYEAKLADRMSFSDHKTFRTMVQAISASGAKECTLELTDLTAIDSAGLGMLIIAIEAAKTEGWSLTVKGAQGTVKQLLMLAKFDKLVSMVD